VLFQYGTGFYSVPTGNYSCSPGGAGTWSTTTLQPTLTGITGAISYQFTNGCAGTANLGAARLP
jgi:hypothetical protein